MHAKVFFGAMVFLILASRPIAPQMYIDSCDPTGSNSVVYCFDGDGRSCTRETGQWYCHGCMCYCNGWVQNCASGSTFQAQSDLTCGQ